eukprot:c17437_g1_i5.p1 GENE.c17437_g1_i5~~c17437_g1_i5.p1  ORF type:complete len:190 (-),score=18.63 c17437_g1_i5:15-584(-)
MVFFCSDLGRAIETAEIIKQEVGTNFVQDPRLRERRFGAFEGLTKQEAKEQYPVEYEKDRLRDPSAGIPGAETWADVLQRGKQFLDEVLRIQPLHATIVVITHGGWIAAIIRDILGCVGRLHVSNCSITELKNQRLEWEVVCLGDTNHLRHHSSLVILPPKHQRSRLALLFLCGLAAGFAFFRRKGTRK